jgi:hypothetical protein
MPTSRLMLAANFAVGTCKPTLKSFSTISAAVISVPSGVHHIRLSGGLSGAGYHRKVQQQRLRFLG